MQFDTPIPRIVILIKTTAISQPLEGLNLPQHHKVICTEIGVSLGILRDLIHLDLLSSRVTFGNHPRLLAASHALFSAILHSYPAHYSSLSFEIKISLYQIPA